MMFFWNNSNKIPWQKANIYYKGNSTGSILDINDSLGKISCNYSLSLTKQESRNLFTFVFLKFICQQANTWSRSEQTQKIWRFLEDPSQLSKLRLFYLSLSIYFLISDAFLLHLLSILHITCFTILKSGTWFCVQTQYLRLVTLISQKLLTSEICLCISHLMLFQLHFSFVIENNFCKFIPRCDNLL